MFLRHPFLQKHHQGTSLKYLVSTKALTKGTWASQTLVPLSSDSLSEDKLLMTSAALARFLSSQNLKTPLSKKLSADVRWSNAIPTPAQRQRSSARKWGTRWTGWTPRLAWLAEYHVMFGIWGWIYVGDCSGICVDKKPFFSHTNFFLSICVWDILQFENINIFSSTWKYTAEDYMRVIFFKTWQAHHVVDNESAISNWDLRPLEAEWCYI